MTRVHAVIPAAGRGVRFGSSENKIFHKIGGRAIVEWTIDAFKGIADEITLIAGADDIERLKKMVAQQNVQITLGGHTRQDSVWNGLGTVRGDDTIVLVHDAARPLVTHEVIQRCIGSAQQYGSGVAAVKVVDALKTAGSRSSHTTTITGDLEREGVWAVQTPQAFRLDLLLQAHKYARRDQFTGPDESSLVQRMEGQSVHLVMGDRRNVKITTTDDLLYAEGQLTPANVGESRTGIGYDIHRLVAGRELWLGGVLIPAKLGLDGHSDADVILHAICDSLLGAAGLPDIGHLFPNSDPQYRGISSLILLERVREALAGDGWRVGNVDSMVIAEQPKIAPYIDEMKTKIAAALLVERGRVSVKATTNEGIGSLGSGDGIACHASATIFRSR